MVLARAIWLSSSGMYWLYKIWRAILLKKRCVCGTQVFMLGVCVHANFHQLNTSDVDIRTYSYAWPHSLNWCAPICTGCSSWNAELLFLHILGNMFRSNVNASAIRLAKVWTGATLISVGMLTSGTILSCVWRLTFPKNCEGDFSQTVEVWLLHGFYISVMARLLFHASIPEANLPIHLSVCEPRLANVHTWMSSLKNAKDM